MGKVHSGVGFLFLIPILLSAETLTLPAVTSLPVGAAASPFFSVGLSGTDDISPGHDVTLAPFTPQPFQRGTYPFVCTQNDCGGDPEQHRGMQGNILIQ